MFSVEFKGLTQVQSVLSNLVRSEVQLLANDIYTEVRKNTPVDTGTARAGWKKNVGATRFSIDNNVPYIGVLDQGRHMTPKGMRGSKQAPKGIIGPSLDSIKGRN